MLKVDLHQMTDTPERLLATLEAAHESDKWAEGKASLFAWLGGLSIVGAIVFFIAAAAGEIGALAGVGVLLLVGAVAMFMVRGNYKQYDLEDRKLATAVQLLKIVSTDLARGKPVSLTIDFRDYATGGDMDHSDTIDGGLFGANVRIYNYRHRWFAFDGALADGNRIALEVTDRVTRKEKPKRKYTKVKQRTISAIALRLRVKGEAYGDAQRVAATLRELSAPEGLMVKSVSPKEGAVQASLICHPIITVRNRYGLQTIAPGHEVDGNTLLRVLLWAYDGLGRASRAAA